ncbi:hypothetical protein Vau01_069900 [Virgisporangium aurantiacum]|uniref:Uncharacterized protein n=2 Tax=Virgisporangium aurantiacum TaxID=175570 RepID=A0A8J3Z8T0_9ACTN|nr:hypothetical protein Vau01_069900 [Virgisporangium aurantiacum]
MVVTDELYASLEQRMAPVCRSAVDTGEVAAYLEASGVNDRVAERDYGVTSVFSLAARLRADHAAYPTAGYAPGGHDPNAVAPDRVGPASGVGVTLVRSALYLTPAVVAVGGATEFAGVPAPAGAGALIYGWATAQALAFLGYRALGAIGAVAAVRVLALGFVAAGAAWAGLLVAFGVTDPLAHAVAAGQVALFASTAVALVTGTEKRVLAAAAGVWIAAGAVYAGTGLWIVGAAIGVLVIVAYGPATRKGEWYRPRPREAARALANGAVGAGQAVLFASVVLAGGDLLREPVAVIPLLVGVPLAELVLVWHQRRVAVTRAALTDRWQYPRRLTRVSLATLGVLAVPVAAGALLTASESGRLAAVVLLAAVNGLCLVLVAHRRLGLAALLVWWPAVLIGVLYRALPGATTQLIDMLVAVVLFAVCVPALGVVAMVLKDRWSYR